MINPLTDSNKMINPLTDSNKMINPLTDSNKNLGYITSYKSVLINVIEEKLIGRKYLTKLCNRVRKLKET